MPWVMKKSQAQAQAQGKLGKQKTAPAPGLGPEGKGQDTAIAATAVTASGSDKSGEQQQEVVSSADAAGEAPVKGEKAHADDPDPSTVFNRYYHLYRNGELEEDVLAAGGVVVKSGYERDNWWVVCANGQAD